MKNDPKDLDRAKWAHIKSSPVRNHLAHWPSQVKTSRTLSFSDFANVEPYDALSSLGTDTRSLIPTQTSATNLICNTKLDPPAKTNMQNNFIESQASHATIIAKEVAEIPEQVTASSAVPVLLNGKESNNPASSDHVIVPTSEEEDQEIHSSPPTHVLGKGASTTHLPQPIETTHRDSALEKESSDVEENHALDAASANKRRRLVIPDHSEEGDLFLIDRLGDHSDAHPVDKSRDVEDLDETETSRHMKSTHHIQQDASKDKQPRLRRLKIRSHHEMDDFLVFDNQDDEDEDEISELEDISSWEKPADVLPTNQDMEYLSGDDVHIDLTDTVEIPEGDVIDSRLESPISRRPDVKWRLRDSPAKIPQGTCFDVENSTRKSRLPLESPESGCGEDDDDYEEEKGANGSGDEYDVEALISDRRQRSNRRRLTEDDFLVQDDEIVYEDDSQLDSESISETQNQESPSKYESMCSQRHRLASIPMENTGFELLTFTSKQAFEIVIQYLASCLVSTDFYSSLQDDEDSKSYFFSALRKFHNEVSVRKDSLLSSQAWGHEYREDVKSLPVFSYSNTVSGDDCMACGRSNHPGWKQIFLFCSFFFVFLQLSYISHTC
eukprot:TRINITY_DN3177_c1_g1_i3.p1 TRINITY_DN3177_c1_g1~~TRINITY_DN3177_c1_g1_i3.p1  ORF type:complete len:701 (+),score=138.69 TRINITY_DN3177_c1_g1_i3:274-2103(+)